MKFTEKENKLILITEIMILATIKHRHKLGDFSNWSWITKRNNSENTKLQEIYLTFLVLITKTGKQVQTTHNIHMANPDTRTYKNWDTN